MPSTLTKQRQVTIVPPLKGQSEAWSRSTQPPLTTPDASNVLIYDRNGRAGICQRPGTSKVNSASQIGSGNPVQALHQTSYINGGSKVNVVIAVANGTIYTSTDAGVTFAAVAGGPHLSTTERIMISSGRGFAYFVDNVTFKRLVLSSGVIATMASIDTGTSPTTGLTTAMWRDRLCVAGPDHNWYMSCSGTHTTWQYGRPRPDSAVAGNNATTTTTGGIGDPITALIPLNDQYMIAGGDRTIWVFRGDPAAGGSIDKLDDGKGVFGPTAWCLGPTGECYFVGHGGLFITDGVSVKALSQDALPAYFASINRSTHRVSLAYDRERLGVWIFVTVISTGASEHLFYDLRNDSFFPQAFPDGHGPLAVLVYDGDTPTDRVVFLGGRDGYLRAVKDANVTDDGTAISSFVFIGPYIVAGPTGRIKTTKLRTVLAEVPSGFTAETNWSVTATLHVGEDAYDAFAAAASATTTYTTGGRQSAAAVRVCGNACFLKLANSTASKFFSFEHALLDYTLGGEV